MNTIERGVSGGNNVEQGQTGGCAMSKQASIHFFVFKEGVFKTGCIFMYVILLNFLATLVALHFTPVSKSVSESVIVSD